MGSLGFFWCFFGVPLGLSWGSLGVLGSLGLSWTSLGFFWLSQGYLGLSQGSLEVLLDSLAALLGLLGCLGAPLVSLGGLFRGSFKPWRFLGGLTWTNLFSVC